MSSCVALSFQLEMRRIGASDCLQLSSQVASDFGIEALAIAYHSRSLEWRSG